VCEDEEEDEAEDEAENGVPPPGSIATAPIGSELPDHRERLGVGDRYDTRWWTCRSAGPETARLGPEADRRHRLVLWRLSAECGVTRAL